MRWPTSLLLSCGCLSRYVRVPSKPPRGFRIVLALTSAGGPSNPRFAQIRSSTLYRPTSSSTYYLHHTDSGRINRRHRQRYQRRSVAGVATDAIWASASRPKAWALTASLRRSSSAEQLPRPCVVLKRSADTSDDAVLRDTAVSLAGQNYLCFANVGTGPAVNVQYRVRATGDTTQETQCRLPEMGPAESFETTHSLNALPADSAVVITEFESVAGSRYRTESTVENQMWVTIVRFLPLREPSAGYAVYLAPSISRRDEDGFSSCLA